MKLTLNGTILAALLGAGSISAQKTAPAARYVGSSACQSCHTKQYETQSRSEHAVALSRAADHPLAPSFPDEFAAYRAPQYRLQWKRESGGFYARVFDGRETAETPVEWAFGAGDQAVTFASQLDEDRYVEHALSYYSASRSLAPTPGHRNTPAASSFEAFGVLYPTFDSESAILRCFQCHSTGPLSVGPKLRIEPSELGV
ncbi:MAG: hypothetical protein ACREUU_08585, partial [Gammaproteobacteria bacterium]